MNHVKVLARFVVVVFWLVFFGVLVTGLLHSGNAIYLSWATWLFYGVCVSVVAYVSFFFSKLLWSIK